VDWLLTASASKRIADVTNKAESIITSIITPIEAERALIRAEKTGVITTGKKNELRGLLARTMANWNLMEISPEVRSRAKEPFPIEPVRTLDAIHLSTALEWSQIYFGLYMFTRDNRILANTKPLGILTIDF